MTAFKQSLEVYRAGHKDGYGLLPFRFGRLDGDRYLLTNFVGEYLCLGRHDFLDFVNHTLSSGSPRYDALKARHFLIDCDSCVAIDLLAAKYRTKQAFLAQSTSLFMFVTTLRCDHSCIYCQVSRRSENAERCDMTIDVADRAIDMMFKSPSQAIKVEFQGGESLLNFGLVRHIVETVERRNEEECRDVEFVLTSNLSALTDEALGFCYDHDVYISTSLDGPRELHNHNRPRLGHDSYEEVVSGIRRVREMLGPHKVSALMTTTRASLPQARAIVDEYVRQGFSSIFLRTVHPYGRAVGSGLACEYSVNEWLTFYREALDYILELAQGGVAIQEEFSALVLRKMLMPYATGYVDLQSPAGIGIAGIVFNYDGDVYCSDEARMLAEMGDTTFRMGSLLSDTYRDIMLSDSFVKIVSDSMAECVPQCSDCVFLPYCGSDPVRHYRTQGDVIGFKPTSDFCARNRGVITHLVELLEDGGDAAATLRSWI